VFSTLWIPLALAVVGIMLRGSAYAFRKEMSTLQQARPFGAVFAASSVLTPFFLGTVAGGIASGRVPLGNAAGDPWSSWLNPTSFVGGVLAVLVTALLAALFLAHDAHAFGEPELEEAFRSRVLLASALTGVVAVVGIFVLAADEGSVFVQPSGGVTLFQGLRTQALPDLILSAAFGLATIWATWDRRYNLARVLGALAVLTVLWGWAFGQYPYMLNGVVTIEDAAGSDSALTAMLVASAVGAVVLVPSLLWLFRLMRKGTFFIDPSPETEPITGDASR
jgi:cytochrome d ubiquinol oxidase subunit II